MKDKYFILIIILIIVIMNYYYEIKIWILNRIIFNRGILTPNRFWYQISDLFLSDGAGVDLYNYYKKNYGGLVKTNQFGQEIYLVTNVNYIKTILDNSPHIFNVGKLKAKFFNVFMSKNVGVSTGCPWIRRRHINEVALETDKLHEFSQKYNQDMYETLFNWKNKSYFEYDDFLKISKKMVAEIVFNEDKIHDDIFTYLSEVNTTEVFTNSNFEVNKTIKDNFIKTINHYINYPNPESLVSLCLTVSDDKEEIFHQIPHFIFPIAGLFITTIPRLLIMIFNHSEVKNKVIQEIKSLKNNNSKNIYQLTYIRKCIMETLRLINPLITTFRTLSRDFSFDEKYSFKKGTQFLILNNPVLRDSEYFEKPNEFIPERWTEEMEKSYYAISFNQGPQMCPAKELVIFLSQSFIYNLFTIKNIDKNTNVQINQIDTENIPQITNPFSIKLQIFRNQSS